MPACSVCSIGSEHLQTIEILVVVMEFTKDRVDFLHYYYLLFMIVKALKKTLAFRICLKLLVLRKVS